MDNQTSQKKFFGKKNSLVTAAIALPIILAVIFVGIYFNLSGFFREPPKVEVQPLNNFKKTLHVVTDIDYAPYSYVDPDGNYQGYDVEMMNEIANRLQMNLDLSLMDWNVANRIFLGGGADIIMNMESDLIINNPNIIATLPTTEKQYVVYGQKDISSVAELYGRRVASLHRMPGLGLDDEISYVHSYKRIFEGLKTNEYEFAICPIQVGNTFVEKFNLDDVFPSYAVQHVYGTLALHPEDTQLRVRVNAVLIQMQQEGRLDALNKKWIVNRYENITLEEMVSSRPWLIALILSSALLVILLIGYTFLQVRYLHSQEKYTIQLQENLDTIKQQSDQLKLQQVELIAEKERAEEANKAKSTFLSNMSHDKDLHKNCETCPLQRAEPCPHDVPSKMFDFLKKIDASSQHLLALINDVLEMSRIESGKMELELTPDNLVTTMDEVRDMFATQMQGKKISFIVDSTGVKNKFAVFDKNRLNRVLLNLLSNAYKFTPEGGKISVTLNQLGDSHDDTADYELRVKDSGIGMTPEFAAKVFEAFERERTSTVSKIQGTGLGMAITKSIIDLMGGDIKVITAPNQGTEFVVNVNFKLAEDMEEELAADTAAQVIDFEGKKLLLVDDIEVNREIAKMLLESEGFIVDTASDGSEAVEKVANAKPGDYDCVLMDIQMPIMNGYDAAKKIRKLENPELANVPIIAMTANAFRPIDVPNMMSTLAKILPA